jgi:hypothetical protein
VVVESFTAGTLVPVERYPRCWDLGTWWLIGLQHGLIDSILRWCLQLQLLISGPWRLYPGCHLVCVIRHLTTSCHSPVSQARPSVLKITNPGAPSASGLSGAAETLPSSDNFWGSQARLMLLGLIFFLRTGTDMEALVPRWVIT